jgi:hypothetical protein
VLIISSLLAPTGPLSPLVLDNPMMIQLWPVGNLFCQANLNHAEIPAKI